MHDIFLSYASEDRETVSSLVVALYRVGVTNFWWDQLQIKLADSIPSKLDEGISGSRYLLAFLSKRYFTKHWTREELDAVRMLERPVIPILLDVSVDEVRAFSPALGTKRAVQLLDDHELVAQQIADLLGSNPETTFARSMPSRETLTVYWGMA